MKTFLKITVAKKLKSLSTRTAQLTLLVFAFTFLSTRLLFSQFVPEILREDNLEIRSRTEKVDPAGWLYFKESAHVEPGDLFSALKDYTGLTANDDMVPAKSWTDDYGWSHIRYQQMHKGLKVEGAEYTEHWKDCYLEIAHGKLIENLEIHEIPTLSEDLALGIVLEEINAEEYAWENTDWENAIKEDLEDSSATYFPEGELLVGYVVGIDFVKESYRLSWKFLIRATSPSSLTEVYIDAHTGEILRLKPVGDENGPATILFGYGEQTIDTKPKFLHHILKANDNDRNIHTKYGTGPNGADPNGDNFWWTSNITDGDDDWGTNHQLGTTVHWAVSESWDYFNDVHGRNGYDGEGEQVRVWADSDNATARRFRDLDGREYIEIGTLNGTYMGALDVCGHEFTHGMTANLSGLGGENEPGALNESFSDIFGVLIERRTEGAINDWTTAEDVPVPIGGGTIIRSLADPGAFPAPALGTPADGANFRPAIGLPDTWQGPRWYFGVFDDGGEHINCGVQNRWFNLLSTGGVHNGVDVQPIGIDNCAEITYLNLSTFIQNGSQYADARQGAINAARIIFGACSFEEIQTTNAWSACGVGPLFTGPCLEMQGPEIICVDKFFGATFTAFDIPGSIFTWTFPPQWTAQASGPGNMFLTVTDMGYLPPYFPYTLEVSVTSSNGGTVSIEVTLDECFTVEPPCGSGGIYPLSKMNEVAKINAERVSIRREGAKKTKLFPNPVQSSLTIAFPQSLGDEKNITLINSSGIELRKWVSAEGLFQINVSDMPSGFYYLRVISKDFSEIKSFFKSN